MGNLFSKTRRVAPLSSELSSNSNRIANVHSTNWYRKLLCCNGNAVTVLNKSGSNIQSTVGDGIGMTASSLSELARDSFMNVQSSKNNDKNIDSCGAIRSPLLRRLELPADRAPLPMIPDSNNYQLIRSGLTVKRNYEGKARAIAFDVEVVEEDDVPNRPQSSLSMGNPTCLPKRLRDRLPALPAISQEGIQRKVSEAAERKNTLMRERSEKIHQKHSLSREMLDRLEAEKQRLLKEKLEDKERRTELRKESLKRRNDASALASERRHQRTRANALEKARKECATAAEALESRMRAAEQKKKAMNEKIKRKHSAFRYKQLRARMKFEGVIDHTGGLIHGKSEEKKHTAEDDNPQEFKVSLQLFGKDKKEEKRIEKEKEKEIEKSRDFESFFEKSEGVETFDDNN